MGRIRLPISLSGETTLQVFQDKYLQDSKIWKILDDHGLKTANSVVRASEETLKMWGLKPAQIKEIKRAVDEFLAEA
jgi:hypothetical protein